MMLIGAQPPADFAQLASAAAPQGPPLPTLLTQRPAFEPRPAAAKPARRASELKSQSHKAPRGAAQPNRGAASWPLSKDSVAKPVAQGSAGEAGKGVISMLQEFVQCSKEFHTPQHRPILQWEFDQRMADSTTLEFRAAVAFVLDGVPHHAAGAWHLSKKSAQRDAAERALGFFITVWGEALLHEESPTPARTAPAHQRDAADRPHECEALEDFCTANKAVCGSSAPRWRCDRGSGLLWHAEVQVEVLGVGHKFAGAARETEAEALSDAARRVLWYLRCPGFENAFELDAEGPVASSRDIPAPPANWAERGDAGGEAARRTAERKTALMRVQNRLQQTFAGKLRPGQGVWEWSYETDGDDTCWPPRCRATVHVPAAGRSFTGSWAQGQREAQIDASMQVAAFLDCQALSSDGGPVQAARSE